MRHDIAAVLLDMDGTLVDSDAAVERAWTVWSAEYGIDPAAALAIAHGVPATATVRRLRPDLDEAGVAASAARQLALQYEDLAGVTALSGAHDLLGVLNRLGLPWAVVTSADNRLAKARLGAAGIVPPLLVTAEDVVRGKPDPEGYLAAADRLGVAAARCLVVEDSVAGLAAGQAAGMQTAGLRGLRADVQVRDLGHLAHLLHRSRMTPWWRDAVGYQVYLPSFADADGDGCGDLDGVVERLDHLVDLGVDIMWLTPFLVSPMRDHGYDIADYHRVEARFGGEAALRDLLAAAHTRGLRVIGDLVVNHTSDAHPWFTAAASARDNPYREYYIWRDPAPDGGPPNNWLSHFGGPAWTLSPTTGQYYLHLFSPERPDLNWRNPAVAAEIDAVLDHWAGIGLDGFRIDTAAYLLKHPDLLDNPLRSDDAVSPVTGATLDWRRQDHRFDIHQPDVHGIHERWRRVADRHDALLVGEVYELDPIALAAYVTAERLHSSFWFGLVESGWDPQRIHTLLHAAFAASPCLSWVQGNHDRPRAATRYGRTGSDPATTDLPLGRRRSLALHTLMAILPGIFWLYQGEELGLGDGVVPPDLVADPLAAVQPDQGRDGVRTPMPWRPEPGLGFTTGRSWLPEGDRTPADTVAVQHTDPGSHLNAVHRLLHTRRRIELHTPHTCDAIVTDLVPAALATGRGGINDATPVTALRRGRVWAVANLTDTAAGPIDLPAPAVYDTDDASVTPDRPRGGPVRLAPQQALLLVER
jgi:alpha-glucosidase